ncbi:threonine--tRNA ligase [Candidatus Woesearchaeota archaeon]|nr:threonine--tRNA ligase [Candidatus Woesearchaeota archaeon]
MKILTIHADFIEFESKKKAIKDAEEIPEKAGKKRIEECLVVFTAVEKRDESNIPGTVQQYLKEIKDIASQVKAVNIVLYPYAHLSSSLSAPKKAEEALKEAEKLLSADKSFKVTRAPFGWYKSFNISCKGHPLSELSREFTAEGRVGVGVSAGADIVQASSAPSLKREAKDEPFVLETKKLTEEEKLKLSATIVTAKAVKELYPNAEVGGIGFYHEQAYVDVAGVKLKPDDFPKLETQAQKIIGKASKFVLADKKAVLSSLQQQIKLDLGKEAVAYSLGNLTIIPPFKEPFVSSTNKISALKILNLSSVYWKNNSTNPQLTRIYGVAFDSAQKLDAYFKLQEEAENRSHLKIGKEQGLFVISELVGAGLPLLAPKGMIIRNELVKLLWELHQDKGYQQVWTPHIAKEILYKTSGHWDKFGDELFKVKGKVDDFILKPMNCPHHMQIFSSFNLSYKDMPVRYFEPATVYRDEKSGQLSGLIRVRSITQDDGHLFCRVSQIKAEVHTIVEIIHKFYSIIGMNKDYWVRLSVRGEDKTKYLGSDEVWNKAEEALEKAAKEMKLPYRRIMGEAAFYGPKLDFMFKDALGREWQLATIQCDFNLPERFDLSYANEKGEKERPVVIHRAITGALERFMAVMIEHYGGKFPLWLSPVQIKVVTVTDRNIPFAEKVLEQLKEQGFRAELDASAETIGKKVREAQLEKANYIITIGDKEVEKKTLAVRTRNGNVKFDVKLADFMKQLEEERKGRK